MKETDFKTKNSLNERDVIEFYDEYASDWDERFGRSLSTSHFIERRWKSFEIAIGKCKPNLEKGLELGVGTGIYLERCSKIFGSITVVDGSVKMIGQLERRMNELNISNVKTITSSVLNIADVPDSSVGCVYFFGLIEHVIDTDSFVSEIRRVLMPGGVVVGVTPNGASPWYKLRDIVRGTGKHCATDRYYTLGELDEIFGRSGFFNIYGARWGLVPAGLNDFLGNVLSYLEPFLERTPARFWLGGLTFGYRVAK